jgi:hypothetical protein
MDLILVLIIIGAIVFNIWRMGQAPTTPYQNGTGQTSQTNQTNPSVANPPPVQNQPMPKTNSNFVYPGAILIGDNTYQSSDDPAKITNWYKNKINGAGMNVTSFIVTSTNDNVLNKLVGANSSTKVSVDIIRNNGENQTTIKLSA